MSQISSHSRWVLNRGAVLLIFLFVMNMVGVTRHLYWMIPSYDSITHLLGGIVIGFLGLYVCYKLNTRPFHNQSHAILLVALAWLAFLGWEVFEYVFHAIGTSSDTLWDLLFDNIGAFVAFQWFRVFGTR